MSDAADREPSSIEPVAHEAVVSDVQPDPQTRRIVLLTENVVRSGLVVTMMLIFALTLVFGFLGAQSEHWPNTKQLLDIVIPVKTLVLGGAAGFYFGSRGK